MPGKKTVISVISISESSSNKSRAGAAGIREQHHIFITFPASSAVQSQHRKASRRQWRPTGFCHQSVRSSTPANKGERTVLNSHVLLTPRDLCQADDNTISNCNHHLPPLLIFHIKKLENYMKESPKATEHPETSHSQQEQQTTKLLFIGKNQPLLWN